MEAGRNIKLLPGQNIEEHKAETELLLTGPETPTRRPWVNTGVCTRSVKSIEGDID